MEAQPADLESPCCEVVRRIVTSPFSALPAQIFTYNSVAMSAQALHTDFYDMDSTAPPQTVSNSVH